MNNIFLTSQASEVLEKVVAFLPKSPSEYRLLFIPTAARLYASRPWLDKDKEKLISLGFQIVEFDLKDATEEEVKSAVDSTDAIFIAGGNAFYLLEHAKKSGFIGIVKAVVAKGKIYIGSSAGSVLAAPDIKYVELFDEPSAANLTDTFALGIIDFRPLPHYGNPKYADLNERTLTKHQSVDTPIIFVKDNEFLLGNGDSQGSVTP